MKKKSKNKSHKDNNVSYNLGKPCIKFRVMECLTKIKIKMLGQISFVHGHETYSSASFKLQFCIENVLWHTLT